MPSTPVTDTYAALLANNNLSAGDTITFATSNPRYPIAAGVIVNPDAREETPSYLLVRRSDSRGWLRPGFEGTFWWVMPSVIRTSTPATPTALTASPSEAMAAAVALAGAAFRATQVYRDNGMPRAFQKARTALRSVPGIILTDEASE